MKVIHLCGFLLGNCLLLPTNVNAIVLKVPLLKRCCIHLHNGTLHQSLSPDELIIRGIVNNIQDTGLAGDSLATPGIVPSVQSQGPPLHIASSDTNSPYSLVARELGICRLTTKFVP